MSLITRTTNGQLLFSFELYTKYIAAEFMFRSIDYIFIIQVGLFSRNGLNS